MSEEVHDNHGKTPAAWTATGIVMFAFCLGAFAVCIAKPWLFWVSIVLIGVGALVGKGMSMMGYGQPPAEEDSVAALPAYEDAHEEAVSVGPQPGDEGSSERV